MKLEEAFSQAVTKTTCVNPLCPLNQVKTGMAVRIRQLCASPAVAERLREIGFCEDRIVKLVAGHGNIICLVCNSRLALSEQLAQTIMVEPIARPVAA